MTRIAQAAKKALSLDNDGISRLLMIMNLLLCWVMAMGAAGTAGLQQMYQQWQLNQAGQVSIYLLPETPQDDMLALQQQLHNLDGVKLVRPLPTSEVRALLQPYFQADQAFPLPIVLLATVEPTLDRPQFDSIVQGYFPTAEIDDNRVLLTRVGQAVRLVQWGVVVLALVLLSVTGLLVMLTVRAGLRSQRRALSILQFLGGTDAFLASLVVRQVMWRSLLGWALACGLAAATVGAILFGWPLVQPYLTPMVWGALILTPLLLPFMAWLTALATARAVVQQG